MNLISNFLQKFLNLEKDNNTKIQIILDVIKEKTGVELQKNVLEIKGETLKINTTAVARNEIFMHQEEIVSSLKEKKIFLKII